MCHHRETEVRRHAMGDVLPSLAVVVGAVQAPMVLQEEPFRARGVHGDLMDALAELGILLRRMHDADTSIARLPRVPAVFGGVDTSSRNGHIHPLWILRVEQDGV